MLESFPAAVFVGTVLGFLSGLGVGGGSLLILWLTVVLHMEPAAARGINLLFFIPAAVVSCLFRWGKGELPLRKIIPAVFAGCASALILSLLGSHIHTDMLKKLFGILLIVTGIREFFQANKQ